MVFEKGEKNISYKNINIDKIIDYAKNGFYRKEVAKILNNSPGTITKKLKEVGLRWDDISDYRKNERYIETLSEAKKGRKLSNETKEKCRKSKLGKLNPMYGKFGEDHHNFGIKLTEKHRKNLTKSHIGVQAGNKHNLYVEIPVKKIIELAELNYTQQEVADYFKVHKATISRKLKLKNIKWKDISNYKKSEKYLRKLRISRLNYMNNTLNISTPNYSINACKFFDFLNSHLGWKGQYAENGGEYHIKELGYWIDYYEPTLNLVIEWNERNHYKNGELREKHILRKQKIKDFLNCNYIDIKEKSNMNFLNLTNDIIENLIQGCQNEQF